jgi:phosphotransferase system IIA component
MSSFTIFSPFDGWCGPLSDAPDEAFSEGLLGDGLSLDPFEGTVRAPFDGEVLSIASTGHAVTLRHACGVRTRKV